MCWGKSPCDVAVVHNARFLPRLDEQDDVVDRERRAAGVGRVRPLEVAQRTPVVAVVPAVVGSRLERLAGVVGDEDGHTSGSRVGERGLHAGAQVVLGRQVHHRVVDEHGVERPSEPERPHVAEDVLAVGVQLAREGQHLRRDVGQGAREVLLEVRRVVAAARAELEQRACVRHLLEDERAIPLRLDRVVRRRGQ